MQVRVLSTVLMYKNKQDQLDACKRHYQSHKQDYIDRRLRRRIAIIELLNEAKSVPCVDCGIRYPTWVMQFDHVRGTKDFTLANARIHGYSLQKIRDEIAKCEIVCANCHAQRTHDRIYCSIV
jgi:hypothetical protein